jgi:hypothetical protein
VSGFSDDGQWWWDGTAWVATSQVVLPQLPVTEFERSGKLPKVLHGMRWIQGLSIGNTFPPLAMATGVPLLLILFPTLRDYRLFRLEQLALATAYLLGPDEPMLTGETAMLTFFPEDSNDAAVVITAAHVLVLRFDSELRFDSIDGQPRWIALAGRASDVKMELRGGPRDFGGALIVSGTNGKWTIRGVPGVFEPKPVLDAWRQAVNGTVRTG